MVDTATSMPFLTLLRSVERTLTSTEKRIVDHLLLVWEELPLVSATELAQDLAINSSSITRLAQSLGFRGYPDMQRAVREELRQRHQPKQPPNASDAQRHWEREAKLIEQLKHFPETHIDELAQAVAQARRVYVVGGRGSHASACYAAHLFQGLRADVTLLPEDSSEHPQRWLDAREDDLLLTFTFKRYAQASARLTALMTARGVRLALITDSPNAPSARSASPLLVLPLQEATEGSFIRITATVSLTLLVASKLAELVGTDRAGRIETYYAEHDVFTY